MITVTAALVLLVLMKANGLLQRNGTSIKGIQMTSMISGTNICSINGQRYFGPNSLASLMFRANGFHGKNCRFILDTTPQYPYIVIYMDNRLADDEEMEVYGNGFKIEYDDDSKGHQCAYFRGPVRVDYENKRGRGNLNMHVIWSQGKCCTSGDYLKCRMRRCTLMSNDIRGDITFDKRFWMSKRFISDNCKRGMASGYAALLVLALVVILIAMAAAFVVLKRKSSKRTSSIKMMTSGSRRSSGESHYQPPSRSSIPPPYSKVKALCAIVPEDDSQLSEEDQSKKDSKTPEGSEEQNPYSFI